MSAPWQHLTAAWRWVRGSPWLVLAGVGLIVYGQWVWLQDIRTMQTGGLFVLAGGILILIAVRRDDVLLCRDTAVDFAGGQKWTWNWNLPVALVGIWLCLHSGVVAYAGKTKVWDLLLMWGGGISLTIYGLVPHSHFAAWWDRLRRSLHEERRTWIVVGALLLVALGLRLAWLDKDPYIQAGDEAAFAIQSVSMDGYSHWAINVFRYDSWEHHPLLFHFLIAISIKTFGQTVAAARIPTGIMGALTVPAVYLLGRRLCDRRVGLVAAIFMAAYPLHVHFSRTAINQVGDPLFATLAFAFLARALRDGDRLEAALGGLALGLSQYFYAAGHMIPLLAVAWVGLYALGDPRVLWRRAGVLAVAVIVAVVVIFPNLYYVYRDPEIPFSPRLKQVSVWETDNARSAAEQGKLREYWTNQVRLAFLAYVQIRDESGFYGAYNPVLGWYAGVPFLIGLIVVMKNWRDPRCTILALWAAGTAVLGGVLLVDPPHFTRYVSTTPALAVLVALGIVLLGATLGRLAVMVRFGGPRTIGMMQWAIPLLLVALLALADLRTYVVDYIPKKLVYGERTIELNEVANILNSFGEKYHVWYFSSLDLDLDGADLIPYQAPHNDGLEYDGPMSELPEALATHGPHAFVIAPERFDEVGGALAFVLPGGVMQKYLNRRTGEPLLYVYFVDAP